MGNIKIFDSIFEQIGFEGTAVVHVGYDTIVTNDGKEIPCTWTEFANSMENLMNYTNSLAIRTKPIASIECIYNGVKLIVETPLALFVLRNAFCAIRTWTRSSCVVHFERSTSEILLKGNPIEKTTISKSDIEKVNAGGWHAWTDASTMPIQRAPSSESDVKTVLLNDADQDADKSESEVKTGKLNSKSADKIKTIMQQTIQAVTNSKNVPLEFNNNPYIEPPTPIRVKTVEQQHEEQDKLMADLAKKVEQTMSANNTIEIDADNWDEE